MKGCGSRYLLTEDPSRFGTVRSRGHVEIHIYAFDGRTGAFTAKIPAAIGMARYDDYTILILISFVSTDLDEEAAQVNQ